VAVWPVKRTVLVRPRSPRTAVGGCHDGLLVVRVRKPPTDGRANRAVVAAVAALDSRTADLRHAEAGLEAIRQQHYESNDALHAAQGALGQAALEVSRLEERIRYVAEGRARIVKQRADLEAQSAAWRLREACRSVLRPVAAGR